ncbi:MAG: hypothetical protein RDV48_05460 [Candidatus Eremiobacteraeota bacterium]|nr:hypothetical protein [Candidatus Eremiobacteraeota bacterium]
MKALQAFFRSAKQALVSFWTPELSFIMLLFLFTRVILTIVGRASVDCIGPLFTRGWIYIDNPWLNTWGAWDTAWYVKIARYGYSPEVSQALESFNQATYGFFPLYPLLIKCAAFFIKDYFIAGLVVSNLCFILACLVLYRLVRLDADEDTAKRTVKYLFLFPAAFIFSAVFSESLFLLLLVLCFYFSRKEKWLYAGISGFFLSLTRPVGIFFAAPLLYEYLQRKGFSLRKVRADVLFLLLFPLGLFVFMAYCYWLTGDALAYFHIKEAGWGNRFMNPLLIIKACFCGDSRYELNVMMVLAVVGLVSIFWRKIGFSYWLLTMIAVFAPLSGGFVLVLSMLRYMLVIFPLALLFAKLSRDPETDTLFTVSLALLQGFLMVFWSNRFDMLI